MAYTPEPYVHYNSTDTLYAWPIADPPWTDAGIIVGDDSITPGTFVFADLQDGVNYYVCVQIGAEPAEGDYQDAIIVAPLLDSPGVLELLERITAPVKTAAEADADKDEVMGAIAESDASATAAAIALLLTDKVVLTQSVSTSGQITSPVLIGDDYLRANDRDFWWIVNAIDGLSVSGLSCVFSLMHLDGTGFTASGVVTDEGDGAWKLSFEIHAGDLQSLSPGEYTWSAGVVDGDGKQITSVMADCRRPAILVRPATWATPPPLLVPSP